jgi:tRNA (guanine37-N1)-methyltransferase
MHVDVFTLFPGMFTGPLTESILKRAQEMGKLSLALHDIRQWADDKHHTVDDTPYGGGGGMIMKPAPLVAAVDAILPERQDIPVILLSPQGRVFSQEIAYDLSQNDRFALVCGHYEGVDERVIELVITDELSIGDYVLTGGELAAMVVIDAVARLLPGVLGAPDAHRYDSHASGLLEGPHYTRPPEFQGRAVPDVLLSGHEANIDKWRRRESLRRTWQRRPDLLLTAELSKDEQRFLLDLAQEEIDKRAAAQAPDAG